MGPTLDAVHVIADWLVGLVESVPSWAVYLLACGIVYAETATLVAGLILPSEAVLLAAGVAAAVGSTTIGPLVVAVCVAAIAGDLTGYWIGNTSGWRLTQSRAGRKFGEQRWEAAQERVRRDGAIAVITGRWIGYVRTIIPPVAGMADMRLSYFAVADVIGASSWATTVLLVGYFTGAALGATLLMYASVAAVVVAGGLIVFRRCQQHRLGSVR